MICAATSFVVLTSTLGMRVESLYFFFSSRRRHTRCSRDWSSDVCSSDLEPAQGHHDDVRGERDELVPGTGSGWLARCAGDVTATGECHQFGNPVAGDVRDRKSVV